MSNKIRIVVFLPLDGSCRQSIKSKFDNAYGQPIVDVGDKLIYDADMWKISAERSQDSPEKVFNSLTLQCSVAVVVINEQNYVLNMFSK